jgi:hypothetical protein
METLFVEKDIIRDISIQKTKTLQSIGVTSIYGSSTKTKKQK